MSNNVTINGTIQRIQWFWDEYITQYVVPSLIGVFLLVVFSMGMVSFFQTVRNYIHPGPNEIREGTIIHNQQTGQTAVRRCQWIDQKTEQPLQSDYKITPSPPASVLAAQAALGPSSSSHRRLRSCFNRAIAAVTASASWHSADRR
jgi:hypothetical protein